MEIVIGYNFDYLLIDGVEKLIQEHKISNINISFCIEPNQSNQSHGRLDSLDLGDERKHISYIIGRGYQVIYALNGLYSALDTKIIDDVRDLIELGVDSFVTSDSQLIDSLVNEIPNIKISLPHQKKKILLSDFYYEQERLEFIDFFSQHKYSNNAKAYIEYRIDSNSRYSGYVTSNFSSSNTKDIVLRNSQIIYFLDKYQKKISLDWRQLLMEFTKIISPLVIAYSGYGKGYGIYIQNTVLVRNILKEFGFSQKIEPNITFIGLRLDDSGIIKLYQRKLVEDGYVLSNKFTENILCTGFMTELDSDSRIVRTKTYLRYPGVHIKNDYLIDISDKFTSLNDFNFLDRIHINYISYEGEDLNKSSVYFVDDFNHKIANK